MGNKIPKLYNDALYFKVPILLIVLTAVVLNCSQKSQQSLTKNTVTTMATPDSSQRQTPIETLQLSLRAQGSLKRTQIFTIGDLLDYTQEDLVILDPESGPEIIAALQTKLGLDLPPK
jgi:DNA-directed RNA polymerase alpha subunit